MAFFAVGKICWSVVLVLFVTVVSGVMHPALAQELDGEALKKLALGGIWQAEHAEYGLWNWNDSGSVCLRVGSTDGDCFDTGTWEITDNVLCYELTKWGESTGERVNCFTVAALDDNRYETLFHGGAMISRMFAFKVLE
ncbi:hypothetical protein ACFFUT_11380 [Pseudohalocynthiibacter aestuariivivens]|jgi:hypothetical protein|uniref:DUF1036 domain-containing protein n=1 Tax=Pseudohalocynthiibacter aestuariivivens TaxID=1591409 RepID=A0ABV5JFZ5_9RHOB|nr:MULTISPECIES: hypothetical protein [Pseudohalocynthiibacter]MBS9716284.1 hypothetical protein [Pseudohalocynthiibacter aestuariivivens]MCK0100908.1 hypothetical protein [Pseudohalocynthiibacter sp. F2068]